MEDQKNKKRITFEEYNKLSEEKKKRFKEMHLDEQFKIAECEDVDYCWRAIKAGIDIKVVNEPIINHVHGFTLNNLNFENDNERTENQRRFRKKWQLKTDEK